MGRATRFQLSGFHKSFLRCGLSHSIKYLFLLTILFSCKNGPRKVVVAHNGRDTAIQSNIKRDTASIDVHDPYETGKDTLRLNKAMDKIFRFPEVLAINRQLIRPAKAHMAFRLWCTTNSTVILLIMISWSAIIRTETYM